MFGKPTRTDHSNKSYKFANGGFLGGFSEGLSSSFGGRKKDKPEAEAAAPTPAAAPAAPAAPAVPEFKPVQSYIPEQGTRR